MMIQFGFTATLPWSEDFVNNDTVNIHFNSVLAAECVPLPSDANENDIIKTVTQMCINQWPKSESIFNVTATSQQYVELFEYSVFADQNMLYATGLEYGWRSILPLNHEAWEQLHEELAHLADEYEESGRYDGYFETDDGFLYVLLSFEVEDVCGNYPGDYLEDYSRFPHSDYECDSCGDYDWLY